MREYFTVAVKENSMENMGLLTEKLNDGFNVDRFYEVGKMGIFILEKFTPTTGEGNFYSVNSSIASTELNNISDVVPTRRG